MASACDMDRGLLERFMDAELRRAEQKRVERHLEGCAQCRHRLAALRAASELLRGHFSQLADQADFSAFEARVSEGIERARPAAYLERLGLWIRESLTHHRPAWIASAATAAAAAVLSAVLIPEARIEPAPVGEPAPEVKTAEVDNQVIIDSMEYAGKRSMIFSVSKNQTTVIWMVDFDGPEQLSSDGDEI